MASTVEISVIDNVIAEAERCRREAISVVGNDARYSELIGQPSSWCIVTEKGLWSRTFHTVLEKDRLEDCLAKGHRVVLTVGLVGHPNIPLHASKYVSVRRTHAESSAGVLRPRRRG